MGTKRGCKSRPQIAAVRRSRDLLAAGLAATDVLLRSHSECISNNPINSIFKKEKAPRESRSVSVTAVEVGGWHKDMSGHAFPRFIPLGIVSRANQDTE